MGNAGQSNYAASKAGIIGFTKSVAKELASRNILANCVAPGFIATDMTSVLNDKVKESINAQIPLKRMGTAEEIANAVYFLRGRRKYIYNRSNIKYRWGYDLKMERRVVVTGIGAITPIGNTAKEFWEGIKAGKCGIDEITRVDTSDLKVKLAAEVKGFNPEDYFDRRTSRRMDLYTKYAVVASREALKDSGITEENTDMTRVGTVIGSGIGGLETMEKDIVACALKGPDRVSPMFIPMGIPNMAAGNVSIDLGLKGESVAMVTACATGTHSIGESYRMIKHGYQDAVLAGGTEAPITKTGIAGFQNIKALSQATDKNRASIPFDAERNGFVMGEGAAVIVLEELEHAKKRGAHIYAEIVGYGASSDAYHITSPSPDGEGAARAMVSAMEDAK